MGPRIAISGDVSVKGRAIIWDAIGQGCTYRRLQLDSELMVELRGSWCRCMTACSSNGVDCEIVISSRRASDPDARDGPQSDPDLDPADLF